MTDDKPNGKHAPSAPHAPAPSRYQDIEPHGSSAMAWIITIIVVAVAIGGFVFFVKHQAATATTKVGAGRGPQTFPVVTATARNGDLPIYLTGLGIVTPLNTVLVRSRVDGQIDKYAFTEGQEVKAGDLLIQIDPRPFQAALDSAKGQLDKDKANLENVKRDLQRYQDLVKTQAITQQQVDTQQSLVQQTQGIVEADQAQVESAQLNLVYSHITAPVDGRVGLRLVDPGNIVHATDTTGLLYIATLHPITVVFTLPEDNIPQLLTAMKNQKALEVDAFSRDLRHKIATGSLLALDNQVDPSTGTLKLKATFDNKEGTLFPQQFVNARILVDTKRSTVLVPIAALQRSPDANYVYVVDSDKKVHLRKVKPGPSEQDTGSVTEGLSPGEVVVTDGVDKLTENASVVPHAAATQPSATDATGGAAGSGSTTHPIKAAADDAVGATTAPAAADLSATTQPEHQSKYHHNETPG